MRYFIGQGSDLGHVTASNEATFGQLAATLASPIVLPLTRAAFHALPVKERQKAKRVRYLTPAAFLKSPAQRKTENAARCNLIALDVDEPAEAQRLITQRWGSIEDYGYIVWHTASSTPEKPRLRVLVNADAIPLSRYPAAVRTIAELLGLRDVSRESLVPVQPMFFPTTFQGETESPIIASNPDGEPFLGIDIIDESEASILTEEPVASPDTSLGDIEFLRTPVEGITLEDAADALNHLDPDLPMQAWIEIAAALKHQFNSVEALELWDKWSSKGKKYVDSEETAYRWSTLKAQPKDRAPVTIRSLFKQAQARGWNNPALARRGYADTLAWINNSARSTEELFDQATQRIAKVSSMIGSMERKSLIVALKVVFTTRNIQMPLPDIKREVRRLEIESAKATGTPAWAKGLCYVTALNVFYRHSVDRKFSPEVLDLMYGSPGIGDEQPMRPRDYLTQVAQVQQVENLRYDPMRGEKRFYTEDGVPYVNTYRASPVASDPERAEEAGKIFWAHVCNLVTEPDYRRLLVDFIAHHVTHPGEKIRWAILMQGAQGCGKTALAVALSAVLGRRNVRKLKGTDVLDGQYNGWAYGQQLVAIEEVRVVGHNRHAVMDKLKPCISDDEISLHRKFEDHRTVPNISNYLMFTNYHDALAIDDSDRRYLVLASPIQTREQVVALGGDYFEKLYGMIRDNPGGLRAWLENWKPSAGFQPDGRAVVTPYLHELAQNSASPLAAAVMQTIEDQPHALVRRDLLSLGCLRGVLDTEHLPMFTDQALAAVVREVGFTKVGRFMISGARHQLWSRGLNGDARKVAEMRDEIL